MDVAEMLEAATAGDADAQYQAAQAYRTGNGVAQDYLKAVKWYGKAAKQGHLDAPQRSSKLTRLCSPELTPG